MTNPLKLYKPGYISLLILTVVILMLEFSCSSKSTRTHDLDRAESIMETAPDSALDILKSINDNQFDGQKDKARYALLLSMALDKNYIDTTDFTVLQPAIDYFLKKGSPDERLRTLYYRGRIFQNQNKPDSAMQAFIMGLEDCNEISDSLTLTRTLVAQGIIYYKQYQIDRFISNNLKAAEIYGNIGKTNQQVRSYMKALNGSVMLNHGSKADSLLNICSRLVNESGTGYELLENEKLSYIVSFGSKDKIKDFLNSFDKNDLSVDSRLDVVRGYTAIGELDTALKYFNDIDSVAESDNLKYLTVSTELYEKSGQYKKALQAFSKYTKMADKINQEIFSKDLLFVEKKHRLEMDRLSALKERDYTIWLSISFVLLLMILSGYAVHKYRLSKIKRQLAEKDNARLLLEKQKAELERDSKALEIDNLRRILKDLEVEKFRLEELLSNQAKISESVREIVKHRLQMINNLLAKEISENDSYAKPYREWIKSIHKDKENFMNSTRIAFSASDPEFIKYLYDHGLTDSEINYLCLYALGLRGKEIGEYMQSKSHYNMSSIIRKKLNMSENDTNIGIYIRRLLAEL